jgi:hypothetical protein
MTEEIFYKGCKIKIVQCECTDSPDDWGNEDLFLVYDHRQFTVRREGFEPIDIYESESAYEEEHWVFPVYAYIHSNVALSLNRNNYPFNDVWDVSSTGYILASKKEFETEEIAVKAAESLVKTWNQYLSGEVYGYIIEKPKTTYSISKEEFDKLDPYLLCRDIIEEFDTEDEWEQLDSCWGYYGDPEESGLLDDAKSIIDSYE